MANRQHRSLESNVPTTSAANAQVTPTLLRFPAVRARTGLSRSTIWRLQKMGHFPAHRRSSRNAVAWLEQDITDWIQSRLAKTA
jgi:prophage regulatory protein